MDLLEFFSSLRVLDSDVQTIFSNEITSVSEYSKAIQKAIIASDTIMDFDTKTKALSVIANCCVNLYKWLLPASEGIISSDYYVIEEKYRFKEDNIGSSINVIVKLAREFENTTPTRQCSFARIIRNILSKVTPLIDGWSTMD